MEKGKYQYLSGDIKCRAKIKARESIFKYPVRGIISQSYSVFDNTLMAIERSYCIAKLLRWSEFSWKLKNTRGRFCHVATASGKPDEAILRRKEKDMGIESKRKMGHRRELWNERWFKVRAKLIYFWILFKDCLSLSFDVLAASGSTTRFLRIIRWRQTFREWRHMNSVLHFLTVSSQNLCFSFRKITKDWSLMYELT